MNAVKEFLAMHNIEYVLHEHPAVYTCEEAEKYRGKISGIACKNLFLRNKKGNRYFLLIAPAEKRVDLKTVAKTTGESKLTFASSGSLQEILGLTPGSVSPFGLINDREKKVELLIDQEVYNADTVSFHPNVNIATLDLSQNMFRKFLDVLGYKANTLDI